MPPKNSKNTKSSKQRAETSLRTTTGAVGNVPDHVTIMRRAYEIHVERGRLHGHDLDDWLQAEHEILETSAPIAIQKRAPLKTKPMSHK